MLISEVTGSENQGTANELDDAIKDILSIYIADEQDNVDIPTDEFKAQVEAQTGRQLNMATLLKAVEDSEFAVSFDKNSIRAKGDMSKDVNTDAEQTVDVGKMAGNQAMKDIKAEL
jgi:hypothetical protein